MYLSKYQIPLNKNFRFQNMNGKRRKRFRLDSKMRYRSAKKLQRLESLKLGLEDNIDQA